MTDFFTWAGLGAMTGAVAAVEICAVTVRRLLKLDTPWVPFVTAVFLSFALMAYKGPPYSWSGSALTFLNGLLLFCTTVGLNDSAASAVAPADSTRPYGKRDNKWVQE